MILWTRWYLAFLRSYDVTDSVEACVSRLQFFYPEQRHAQHSSYQPCQIRSPQKAPSSRTISNLNALPIPGDLCRARDVVVLVPITEHDAHCLRPHDGLPLLRLDVHSNTVG